MSTNAHTLRKFTQWSNDDLGAAAREAKHTNELVKSLDDLKQLTQLLEALGTSSEHATSILDGTAKGIAHFVQDLSTANPHGLNRPVIASLNEPRQAAYNEAVEAVRLARRHARVLHGKLMEAATALAAVHADHDQAARRMRRENSR